MIKIDTESCDGCGDCAAFCPNDCLGLEYVQGKTSVYFQLDACVRCGVCVSVCPNEAIALIET